MKKPIAITLGEPRSINSEIIYKSWKKIRGNNFFLIGNFVLFDQQLKKLGLKIPLKKINSINEFKKKGILQILDVPLKFKNPFKINDKINNLYNLSCLNLAHSLANEKKVSGFISAPIDKKIFNHKFLGITEYLAFKNNVKNSEAMMIYNKNLSVVPLTTHVDIKDVYKKISSSLIKKKILTVNNFFLKYFKKKPKIAILGLNPHNSESRRGSIERRIIKPAVLTLQKKKINILGPFSADTIFIKNNLKNFDVVIGMYHDQVLGPIKTLFEYDAINITIGLPFIRITPDHGPNKSMVGKNKSTPASLIKALNFLDKR